ncbi:hypothetical protein MPTK1_8g11460 [Marchantia polymorpha subsp. ruderalis]|uniref:Uncharacterized protein n=1 Tax=Marchantia polymorpha TaxID=3197 RepID=A0A2R6XME6_MARPO|nr:hypothetical protein MARPO_0008s0070 [Marchantia polymorpha]BBN19531.1 hypothetical protein Mp_8g11460 [Marchantia polymorpha subsp. ruderalis]|eukprot:PTQ47293.1 hypothetical protein MARPO_0008s0070 [Marchantia polymorpha]
MVGCSTHFLLIRKNPALEILVRLLSDKGRTPTTSPPRLQPSLAPPPLRWAMPSPRAIFPRWSCQLPLGGQLTASWILYSAK